MDKAGSLFFPGLQTDPGQPRPAGCGQGRSARPQRVGARPVPWSSVAQATRSVRQLRRHLFFCGRVPMAEGDRDNHPSPAELDRFLLGEMSPRQAAPVLAHLLRGCEICQTRMEPMAAVMFGTGPQHPEPSAQSGAEYDFPLFKALATARRYAATAAQATQERPGSGRRPGLPFCWKLPSRQPPARRGRSATGAAASGSSRCAVPCATATRKPGPDRHAGRGDGGTSRPSHAGSAALADLQACALAELGNARRIADDLAGRRGGPLPRFGPSRAGRRRSACSWRISWT